MFDKLFMRYIVKIINIFTMKYIPNKLFLTLTLIVLGLYCYGQTVIQLEKKGGVYKIPCVVNGLKLKLIFDTGASNVCISQSIASMMMDNGYLSDKDIKGTAQSRVADGRIIDNTKIILKKIQIGDKVLHNVEAVVIHGQSAPLLLGQSALKKLGRYSISGEKLIIGIESPKTSAFENANRRTIYNILNKEYDLGTYEKFVQDIQDNVKRKKLFNAIKDEYNLDDFETFTRNLLKEDLSLLDIEMLFQEAEASYYDKAFSIAFEKYQILYNNNILNSSDIIKYADCYYYLNKKEEALKLYLEIQEDINLFYPQLKSYLYYQICRCLWDLEDYDAAIRYGEKARYLAEPWSKRETNITFILASIYHKKGDKYIAVNIYNNYINKYLSFMDIKSTDCWDKFYVDDYLAELYYRRAVFTPSFEDLNEYNKYMIIAAAWGNKEAIEYCKEKNKDYSSKPYIYEY